ncbi:glycosyltransferase family 2 protein [Hassallia byssoidea VB512170]|uniref:Glycosyltransferase family 2 protein n=1 Tax=Hassallia byssoidea VB512170 TaxID=1304833 RepID=A0A846H3K2_9CYAN|nr:glycosyltransferase family 2 protein [Hassalia byssoidea]NEU71184.1 glycosyltransferase family 2 protein [Hassalia byssoidea VB512170]
MNKLLTIAIPTFNRAQFLEEQLNWLSKAIKGFESECEVIICDNFSSDNTQEIIQKWQPFFKNTTFISHRNTENIGLMPNLACCIEKATSKYVWVIGDDDPIHEITLAYVVNNLKKHPEIALLILNFSWLNVVTGQLASERCFDITNEEVNTNGKALIEHYLQENFSCLAFMTAQVYKTQAAQQALEKWRDSANNREGQIYWTAFCALQGSVKITKDVYVQYACGMNSIVDAKLWFKMRYSDLPKVYVKLMELGYSQTICRKFISKHFAETNWYVILGALRRWPFYTVNILTPYFSLVGVSTCKSFLSSQQEKISL